MSNVTYLILLHNNERDLPALADSIKNIESMSKREYIIVDDASTDKTKSLAQELFATLPRVTIISNEAFSGPAFSINKVMKFIQGDYVHFVFGGHILEPFSTDKLIYACQSLGAELAFGLHGTIDDLGNRYKNNSNTGDITLIDAPIKAILENKITDIRMVGYSGTLISQGLLQKIAGTDIALFLHNMSLALRCGKYSKFAAVKETLYYISDSAPKLADEKFEEYDNLCAISNFMEAHNEIAEHYKPEIYKALLRILWKLDRYNIRTIPKYIFAHYVSKKLELPELIMLYRQYVDTFA